MLAKISDAGAKANCYLSCFNDLLGEIMTDKSILGRNNEIHIALVPSEHLQFLFDKVERRLNIFI